MHRVHAPLQPGHDSAGASRGLGSRPRAVMFAVAVLAASGVLAACGGGGGDSSAPTSGTSGSSGSTPSTSAAAGTSEGSSSATGPTAEQICGAVSDAAAEAIAGTGFTKEPRSGFGQPLCRWEPAVEKMEQFRGFSVSVGDVGDGVEFERVKGLVAEGKAEPVSGIGDGAFWDFTDGTGMVALVVKDGQNDIKVRMDSSSLTDAQMKPLELAVARDVVAKL